MPTYEFRCRTCGQTYVVNRPMDASNEPAACPNGHDDTVRLLGVASAGGSRPDASPSAGGCCGGGCGCG
ncbi:MAG: zinc ribbon domain-containing protein [Actinobacteria bacterium]|nr:zinc ribbon domain-containing protein [Actinomycetota bacterium]